jgi:hypothetical protein
MMHGTTNIKFMDAKQASDTYKYKNTKRKLYRTNAAIWYNKVCRQKQLIPTYINISINGTNKQCQRTHKAATKYRINQEIKFLYIKKQNINEQLYKLTSKCSDSWQKLWSLIQHIIDAKLNQEMELQYEKLNRKIDALQNRQRSDSRKTCKAQGQQFYNRTTNLTNITFTIEETELLNQGLQHSIENL